MGQSATSLPPSKTHGGQNFFGGGIASFNPGGQDPSTEINVVSRKRELSKDGGMDLINPGKKKRKKATGAKFI